MKTTKRSVHSSLIQAASERKRVENRYERASLSCFRTTLTWKVRLEVLKNSKLLPWMVMRPSDNFKALRENEHMDMRVGKVPLKAP